MSFAVLGARSKQRESVTSGQLHNSLVGTVLDRRGVRTRAAHRVACELKVCVPGRVIHVNGRTTNVSATGLSVQVPCALQAGSPVEASFASSNGTPMLIRGVVVHARRVLADEYEIGIQIKSDRASAAK